MPTNEEIAPCYAKLSQTPRASFAPTFFRISVALSLVGLITFTHSGLYKYKFPFLSRTPKTLFFFLFQPPSSAQRTTQSIADLYTIEGFALRLFSSSHHQFTCPIFSPLVPSSHHLSHLLTTCPIFSPLVPSSHPLLTSHDQDRDPHFYRAISGFLPELPSLSLSPFPAYFTPGQVPHHALSTTLYNVFTIRARVCGKSSAAVPQRQADGDGRYQVGRERARSYQSFGI